MPQIPKTWAESDKLGRFVADHWLLDSDVTFLNHGSFGACPRVVLAAQRQWADRLERQPLDFMVRDLEAALDEVRSAVVAVIGGQAERLAFVPNATTAVNSVVSNLHLRAGDELLATTHTYNACRNILERAAAKAGASVQVVELPLPCASAADWADRIDAAINDRTVFALIDQVTSPSAVVLDVASIVRRLQRRGVRVMVDAAHVPGHLDVDVDALGASWWTGNLHKWLCTPKGAAVLYTSEGALDQTQPATTSHAYNASTTERSRYLQGFDWPGTWDPTPVLAAPAAIAFLSGLLPGGLGALMARNRELCALAALLVTETAGLSPVSASTDRGAMCAFFVREGAQIRALQPSRSRYIPVLQDELHRRYRIEVPVVPVPVGSGGRSGDWLLRISAHAYNGIRDFEVLCAALKDLRGRDVIA